MKEQRPIKFRAWLKESGEILGPSVESEEKRAVGFVVECDSGYENSDFIFMQYTGLKDKNGVEIWEGDVVRHIGLVGIEGMPVFLNSVIGYEEGEWRLLGNGEERTLPHYITVFEFDDERAIEVIGNIYENPELLEVKS